jgi:hypothetical protein
VSAVWRWLSRHFLVAGVIGSAIVAAVATALPRLEEWRELRSPCEGALSRGLVDDALADSGLERQEVGVHEELGRYQCVLYLGEELDDWVLSASAVTLPDDVDTRLMRALDEPDFVGRVATAALPEGLPGVVNYDTLGSEPWTVYLAQRCPSLGTDFRGRDRRMLVTLRSPFRADYDAMVRLAVETANAASRQLGCGADPLSPPDAEVPQPRSRQLTASAAADSPCTVLSLDELPAPRQGKWLIGEGITETFPVDRCTLTDGPALQLDLTAWYGSPGDVVRADLVGYEDMRSRSSLEEQWQPALMDLSGFAMAECEGETALFAARRTWSGQGGTLTQEHLAQALAAFATDRAEQRGCTNLRLPGSVGR